MNTHIDALGWSLLHSLWQGAVIWLAPEAMLVWPGPASPRVRGRLAGGALAAFVLLVAGTFGWLAREGREEAAAITVASPVLIVAAAEGPSSPGGQAKTALKAEAGATTSEAASDETIEVRNADGLAMVPDKLFARDKARRRASEKSGNAPSWWRTWPMVAAEAPTDADGRFHFSNLPPGRLKFTVPGSKIPRGMAFPVANLPEEAGREVRITVE